MKKLKTSVLSLLLVAIHCASAQKMYRVHEDVVKPSMAATYESLHLELNEMLTKFPIENLSLLVMQSDNYNYYFIAPIEGMADLDKAHPLTTLAEKVGKEKMEEFIGRMDKCYDIERDFIIILNEDLSYMPDGMTQTPEGENYREQSRFYYTPSNRAIVSQHLASFKNLMSQKASRVHYRIYESGFGTEAAYYMLSIAAKDKEDFATKMKANRQLLGEDGNKARKTLYESLLKIEEVEGIIRPDLFVNKK